MYPYANDDDDDDVINCWSMCRKPCMAARPAFSQYIQPYHHHDHHTGPDTGRPAFRSSATYFHNVRPPQARHDFVIHPELASENLCAAEDSLQSLPVRQCDIDAAVIQRASQRHYVKNPFVY